MRASITGLDQASENARDGISVIQIAEGALDEVHDMLNRMTELADQSMNGTYSGADRAALDEEYQNLAQELDRIARGTSYGTIKLLDGSLKQPPEISMLLQRRSALQAALVDTERITGLVALDAFSNTVEVARSDVEPEVAAVRAQARAAGVAAPTEPTGAATATTNSIGGITITGDGVYEIADGFTGKITIEPGKNVLLRQADSTQKLENVSIVCGAGTSLHIDGLNIENSEDKSIIDFTGEGNSINILGNNKLVLDVTDASKAVVHSGTGVKLDIFGTGKIEIKDISNISKGAAIGGDNGESSGVLSIRGGTIAISSVNSKGAGIGGGLRADGGEISILAGNLTVSSHYGAAIGGGAYANGGTIAIGGGTIDAKSKMGACIGGGSEGSGGAINIFGNANIKASNRNGACIGGGSAGTSGDVSIRGGEIYVTADYGGAGIGNGAPGHFYTSPPNESSRGNIHITAGKITVVNSGAGASIGNGGDDSSPTGGDTVYYTLLTPDIAIDGGTVNITTSGDRATGAAIGGGGGCFAEIRHDQTVYMVHTPPSVGANLTISNGNITINNGWIGGGRDIHYTDGINQYADDGTLHHTGGTLHYTDDRIKGPLHPDLNNHPEPDPDHPDNPDPGPDLPEGGLILHIGEGSMAYDYMSVYIEDMGAEALGLTDTNVRTQQSATDALGACRAAINQVSLCRATLGSYQNRLEHTINSLGVTRENATSARAQIRDADMAEEIMTYTKQNILNQSSQAMLAQAMRQPESVLQLLQ